VPARVAVRAKDLENLLAYLHSEVGGVRVVMGNRFLRKRPSDLRVTTPVSAEAQIGDASAITVPTCVPRIFEDSFNPPDQGFEPLHRFSDLTVWQPHARRDQCDLRLPKRAVNEKLGEDPLDALLYERIGPEVLGAVRLEVTRPLLGSSFLASFLESNRQAEGPRRDP
jgi:hypothetical protein